MANDQKPADEMTEDQLETVAGGIALQGAVEDLVQAGDGSVHTVDKASPVLQQACATGVHMKEATITSR